MTNNNTNTTTTTTTTNWDYESRYLYVDVEEDNLPEENYDVDIIDDVIIMPEGGGHYIVNIPILGEIRVINDPIEVDPGDWVNDIRVVEEGGDPITTTSDEGEDGVIAIERWLTWWWCEKVGDPII